MTDGVSHEGYEREARIRHPRDCELEPQRIVQREAAIPGGGQQHGQEQLRAANCLHVGENVPPTILAEHVVQPEKCQPEEPDP